MPQVDFTLEEVKGSIRAIVREELEPVRLEFRQELQKEVGLLRQEMTEFREEFHDFQVAVADSFHGLTEEVRQIRRITRQHSADIAELRAASA